MALPPGADLSKIPLARPPPGHVSNFDNPEASLAHVVSGVGIAMTVTTGLIVVARLMANMKQSRKWYLDDFFCVFAFALFTTYMGLQYSLKDTARHEWDVPVSTYAVPSYSKRIYAMGMVFGPGMTFAKCAILILYLRIFQVSRTLRALIWIGIFVVCSAYLVAIPLFTYYCTPRANEDWDLMLLNKCKKNGVLALIQGVIGVVTDIYIFVLPLPAISHLRLPLRKKIGVFMVFIAGLLGIAAASLSLVYRVKNWQRTDTTWNSARVCICVFVEGYTTVIVSCAPSISAFWKHTLSRSRVVSSLRSLLSSQRVRSSHGEEPLTAEEKAPEISALAPVSRFTGVFGKSTEDEEWTTATTSTMTSATKSTMEGV